MHDEHKEYVAGCEQCQRIARARTFNTRSRNAHEYRERRGGRLVSTHPKCRHGTYTGYIVYSCQCQACTDANSRQQAQYRNEQELTRLAEVRDDD